MADEEEELRIALALSLSMDDRPPPSYRDFHAEKAQEEADRKLAEEMSKSFDDADSKGYGGGVGSSSSKRRHIRSSPYSGRLWYRAAFQWEPGAIGTAHKHVVRREGPAARCHHAENPLSRKTPQSLR